MVRPNKPMENKDSGGGHGIRRILRAIVALIVSAATLLTGASTALATQAAGLPGYWYNPASDGSGWFTAWHGTSLGVAPIVGIGAFTLAMLCCGAALGVLLRRRTRN